MSSPEIDPGRKPGLPGPALIYVIVSVIGFCLIAFLLFHPNP